MISSSGTREKKSARRWIIGATVVVLAVIAWVIVRHAPADPATEDADIRNDGALGSGAVGGPAAPAGNAAGDVPRTTEEDRRIFDTTMRRALEERLDTLPIGERVVTVGRWFVGDPYTPGTLERQPEALIVNLREFDCVTYVESILAMARILDGRTPTFDRFLDELRRIRYREGRIDGYASRLHYFSEWIQDNAAKGIVRDITQELGGVTTDEPIDFMSENRDAYAALADDAQMTRILAIEERLSGRTRYYIPEGRVAEVSPGIRNGDIIAITSVLPGLDIAHTGFALWIDDELYLMNAPLVGEDVEISDLPLAQRVARIEAQDGIMVARPVETR